jgi:Gas vesicle synthesis protein GvpL/GvpF
MKFYLYCFAEGVDRLNKPPRGVFGARVQLMKIDDLVAVVSVSRGGGLPLQKALLAHAAVVRHVFKQTTPIPFRFGQAVTEQYLRNYVSTHRHAIKARLAHVRGCAEMNVRLMGPGKNPPTPAFEYAKPLGPGTRFLLEKRRDFRGDEWRGAQTAELNEWFNEKLGKLTRDEIINVVPSDRGIIASVSHLVKRADVVEYRTKMGLAIEELPETRFMVSGPWAPYSFANIELEFPLRIGVS